MKNRSGEKIKLASIDELLGVVNEESAMEIEISKIHPFKNHPFKVLDDEKMQELVESVKINGVLAFMWEYMKVPENSREKVKNLLKDANENGVTGPLSTDGTWGNHMQFTSKAIGELGAINGPRCCKRDAMIAFKNGIDYVNAHYGVTLQYEQMQCGFTDFNEQCIKERCPFHE